MLPGSLRRHLPTPQWRLQVKGRRYHAQRYVRLLSPTPTLSRSHPPAHGGAQAGGGARYRESPALVERMSWQANGRSAPGHRRYRGYRTPNQAQAWSRFASLLSDPGSRYVAQNHRNLAPYQARLHPRLALSRGPPVRYCHRVGQFDWRCRSRNPTGPSRVQTGECLDTTWCPPYLTTPLQGSRSMGCRSSLPNARNPLTSASAKTKSCSSSMSIPTGNGKGSP